ERDNLFFAGQMTGVEGYVESAASGLVAGINASRLIKGEPPLVFPRETAIGSLAHYVTSADPNHFQPMNINFGLFAPPQERIKNKQARQQYLAERALSTIQNLLQNCHI